MIRQKQIENIFRIKVSLTAAQIQTANSAPIDVGLPASGTGYYYRITQFDCRLNFNTTPFTSLTLFIGVSDGSSTAFRWKQDILQQTQTIFSAPIEPEVPRNSYIENSIVGIIADADSATGDSTIDCYISVEKVAL